jgi:peptidoglycan/LPS O-acetylase OafA/YrhL
VFAWLLMLPNLLTGPNVPNVTWTLSYEMVFYLLLVALFSWGVHRRSGTYATAFAVGAVALGGVLPMAALTRWATHASHGGLALNATADALVLGGIVLAVSSRSRVARAGAAVAGLTALVLVMVNQGSPSPWEGCVILALMFTGTLIYRTQQRQPGTSTAVTAAIVAGVLALITAAGLWHGAQRHHTHQWLIQWATSVLLAGATFGLGLAASHRRVPRWCAWLGMISFSVYLLHPLVFDAYRSVPALHRRHTMPVQVLMFAGCLAVIIAISAVTYYLVEKPMQRLGRRLSGPGGRGGSGPGSVQSVAVGGSVGRTDQAGQAGQAGPPDGYATGAATGSGSGVPNDSRRGAGSGRETDSARPGAPTAARSASSSSAVAGGSGASP